MRAWAALGAAALLATAVSAGPAAGSSVFAPGPGTSLSIVRSGARIVGTEALVLVRCSGPRNGICNGTLTVSTGGRRHKVPFSVGGGSRQALAVTVGRRKALRGARGRAVARTAQPAGGYLRSREVLRFR